MDGPDQAVRTPRTSSLELTHKEHMRGIGRVIADSWPYDDPLGCVILEKA
ncbi:hypothetical protein [Streptomyces sp. NBC_00005]